MKSYLYAKNRLMLIILSWLSADEALPSRHDFQQTETILSTLHIPYVLKPDLDQLRATLQPLLATPRPQACACRRGRQHRRHGSGHARYRAGSTRAGQTCVIH